MAAFLVTAIPAGAQAASDRVCFCHNVNHNPVDICTDNNALIEGHGNHVEKGDDLFGRCDGCGNGELDDGEACDDGNDDDTDACLNNCTLPIPEVQPTSPSPPPDPDGPQQHGSDSPDSEEPDSEVPGLPKPVVPDSPISFDPAIEGSGCSLASSAAPASPLEILAFWIGSALAMALWRRRYS
ncbi:MAG TPA: hypothetical protein VJP40_01155 [bacterium]|nr:hypothetical protein [bacterium]